MINCTFEWDGDNYEIEVPKNPPNFILLPNGDMLEIGCWLESYPPQPDNDSIMFVNFKPACHMKAKLAKS